MHNSKAVFVLNTTTMSTSQTKALLHPYKQFEIFDSPKSVDCSKTENTIRTSLSLSRIERFFSRVPFSTCSEDDDIVVRIALTSCFSFL